MKERDVTRAITFLLLIKHAYEKNKQEIMDHVREQERSLPYGTSINWTKVKEAIENSLKWDAIVDNIEENIIPRESIAKIRNAKDTSLLNQYKELVNFIFEHLPSYLQRRISYIRYWQTTDSTSSITSNSTSHMKKESNDDTNKEQQDESENSRFGCVLTVLVILTIFIIVVALLSIFK